MGNFLHRSARFRREIGQWVQAGILTPEQALLLHERYELESEAPWYVQSGFILKAVALVLAGMALFLLIAENWSSFPLALRAATGLVPLLLAYAVGGYYQHIKQNEKAVLAFFFASLAFGGNIFLQAQIFHISVYYPDGFLWWLIGMFPIALYYRSTLHNFLLHAVYFFWISVQMPHAQFSWASPVVLAALLYLVWRDRGMLVLLFATLNAYVFLINMSDGLFANSTENFILLLSTTTLLCIAALSWLQSRYERVFLQRLALVLYGVLLVILLSFTFEESVEVAVRATPIAPMAYALFVVGIAGLTAQKKRLIGMHPLIACAPVLCIHSIGLLWTNSAETLASRAAIGVNIFVLGYALWHIVAGLRQRIKPLFMGGVLLVLLLATSRYFDYFESYIAMSIVFLFCSGLLWGVNAWWNKTTVAVQEGGTHEY